MLLVLIAVGGALGALARYAAGGLIQAPAGAAFPWGTLVVNVTGSLLLAFIVRTLEGIAAPPELRGFLAIGFCGAFTTFSTFSYEAFELMQGGQWNRASVYVFGSVLLCLAATLAGFRLAAVALGARG